VVTLEDPALSNFYHGAKYIASGRVTDPRGDSHELNIVVHKYGRCEMDISDAGFYSNRYRGLYLGLLLRLIVKDHQGKPDRMFLNLVPCMLKEENLNDGDFVAHVLNRILEIRARTLDPKDSEASIGYLAALSWMMHHILPETLLSLPVTGDAEKATITAFCHVLQLDRHRALPAAHLAAVATSMISSSESAVAMTLGRDLSIISDPFPTEVAEHIKKNLTLAAEAAHVPALELLNPAMVVPGESSEVPRPKSKKGRKKKEKERMCAMEGCGVVGSSLKMCGRCKKVFYCTVAHQKEHWHTHKTACKTL